MSLIVQGLGTDHASWIVPAGRTGRRIDLSRVISVEVELLQMTMVGPVTCGRSIMVIEGRYCLCMNGIAPGFRVSLFAWGLRELTQVAIHAMQGIIDCNKCSCVPLRLEIGAMTSKGKQKNVRT
jgi:hypothetical protein